MHLVFTLLEADLSAKSHSPQWNRSAEQSAGIGCLCIVTKKPISTTVTDHPTNTLLVEQANITFNCTENRTKQMGLAYSTRLYGTIKYYWNDTLILIVNRKHTKLMQKSIKTLIKLFPAFWNQFKRDFLHAVLTLEYQQWTVLCTTYPVYMIHITHFITSSFTKTVHYRMAVIFPKEGYRHKSSSRYTSNILVFCFSNNS